MATPCIPTVIVNNLWTNPKDIGELVKMPTMIHKWLAPLHRVVTKTKRRYTILYNIMLIFKINFALRKNLRRA